MKKWPIVRLDQVCTFVNGRAYNREELLGEGKYTVLRVGNFFTNNNWFYSDLELPEDKYCDKGDLLYAWSASFGPRIWDGEKVIYHYHIWKVIPDNNLITKKFLYWLLDWDTERIKADQGTGATMMHVTKGAMEAREIPLPPLSEQKRIAGILDAADRLRQQDKALIGCYNQLAQSVFLEMFGDPVRNERGWEVKQLEDITEFMTSGSRGWAQYYRDSGDVFLRIQNVGYGELRLDDLTYVHAPNTAEAKRTLVQNGDMLLSITADLGRTAVIPDDFPPAFINQHLALVRMKQGVLPMFISNLLSSQFGRRQFATLNKGGVKAGLNFEDIRSIKILLPPLPLQQKFATVIENIEHQKAQAEASGKESEGLFQSLLQSAFKGNL